MRAEHACRGGGTPRGWLGRKLGEPPTPLRGCLDRPRGQSMRPFEDPWKAAAILCAADRRHCQGVLLAWASELARDYRTQPVRRRWFGIDKVSSGLNATVSGSKDAPC